MLPTVWRKVFYCREVTRTKTNNPSKPRRAHRDVCDSIPIGWGSPPACRRFLSREYCARTARPDWEQRAPMTDHTECPSERLIAMNNTINANTLIVMRPEGCFWLARNTHSPRVRIACRNWHRLPWSKTKPTYAASVWRLVFGKTSQKVRIPEIADISLDTQLITRVGAGGSRGLVVERC